MAQIVFTELLGGRVLRVDDDLDRASLGEVGDGVLTSPSGPAIDASGAVLVAEPDLHAVVLAAPGAGWQRFGTHGGGTREFNRPMATAFLGLGTMVVLDSGNRRLVFIDDPSGSGWTTYGHAGLVPSEGGFVDPRGLAVDGSDRIWVSDPGAHRLTRMDSPDGDRLGRDRAAGGRQPADPVRHRRRGDGVAVIDAGNYRLLVLDGRRHDVGDGRPRRRHLGLPQPSSRSAGTNLVVADAVANELRLLEPDGRGLHGHRHPPRQPARRPRPAVRLAGRSRLVSDSMRILTYNTQMRSALMEMGFPPSIPPVYTAPLRAKLISKAILDSPDEIDVVCLNEIFDEPLATHPQRRAARPTSRTRSRKPTRSTPGSSCRGSPTTSWRGSGS